jgi:hypothetical protein
MNGAVKFIFLGVDKKLTNKNEISEPMKFLKQKLKKFPKKGIFD